MGLEPLEMGLNVQFAAPMIETGAAARVRPWKRLPSLRKFTYVLVFVCFGLQIHALPPGGVERLGEREQRSETLSRSRIETSALSADEFEQRRDAADGREPRPVDFSRPRLLNTPDVPPQMRRELDLFIGRPPAKLPKPPKPGDLDEFQASKVLLHRDVTPDRALQSTSQGEPHIETLDWDKMRKKLLIVAGTALRGRGDLVDACSPEDVVHDAIKEFYEMRLEQGTFQWNRQDSLELAVFKYLSRAVRNNSIDRLRRQHRFPASTDDEAFAIDKLVIDDANERDYATKIREMHEFVGADSRGQIVLDVIAESAYGKTASNIEISESTGMPLREVENAKKRLRTRLPAYLAPGTNSSPHRLSPALRRRAPGKPQSQFIKPGNLPFRFEFWDLVQAA